MKRVISLALVFVLCLSLCACGSRESTEPPAETSQSSIESTPVPTEMSPTETPAPVEPTESTPLSFWTTEFMVDDFGDKTDVACLRGITTGVFSNTATASSDLTVVVFMNPAVSNDKMISSFAFHLLEYNETPATYIAGDNLTIKIKIGDTVYEDVLKGTPPNGDLLLMNGANYSSEVYKQMYNALLKEKDIRCIIEIGSSKYNFTVAGSGFVATANEMMRMYGYDSFDVSKYPVN